MRACTHAHRLRTPSHHHGRTFPRPHLRTQVMPAVGLLQGFEMVTIMIMILAFAGAWLGGWVSGCDQSEGQEVDGRGARCGQGSGSGTQSAWTVWWVRVRVRMRVRGVKDEGRWLGQWMSVGQDLDHGQGRGRCVGGLVDLCAFACVLCVGRWVWVVRSFLK